MIQKHKAQLHSFFTAIGQHGKAAQVRNT